ncbi:hypothetical protein CI109_104499 [Kwoniella shandongensis]|uniref:Uncharacterized protein n=1 Tax=Kwoniella shandongensis TaxID=1734106 RepID=A0A5M6BS98_9TREE|nr:uncharacterized protein CI109_006800 [Kwoniella shandongensis]KAA5524850.1 hypothetical protein CI109_006800 [Kwoniella shandongensis]
MSHASTSRQRSVEEIITELDVEGFDWASYEGTYRGRALITRLSHIPSLLLSPSSRPTPQTLLLTRTALIRLIPHIKSTWDHELYLRAINQIYETLHPSQRSFNSSGTGGGQEQGAGSGGLMDLDDDDDDGRPATAGSGAASGSRAGGGGEDEGVPDIRWVESVREQDRKEATRLDVELRGYMSNLIKESIRLTYLAFAQLSLKVGSYQGAMKNYAAVREYSTSPQHHVDLGVAILETSIAFNLASSLPGHISKLEATLDRLHPPPQTSKNQAAEAASVTASDLRERRANEARSASVRRSVMVKIRVARGLVALGHRDWTKAGKESGAIEEEEGGLGDWEGKAISTADVALITAFCVLASADRARIRAVLLDRASFRAQIDDHATWILDLVRSFVDAKYGDVMTLLRRAAPILLLNPFLSEHSTTLIDLIKSRSIVQYVQPFSTIQISTMAQAFGLPENEMLGLVEDLVQRKEIKGKIDLIDKVVSMTSPNHRGEMFETALKVGRTSSEMTQAAMLRMKLVEAGIVVDPRAKSADSAGDELWDVEEGGNESTAGLPTAVPASSS